MMTIAQRENLSKGLLRYGVITEDISRVTKNGYRRMRVIEYQGKKYFHKMFNGTLIECYEIKDLGVYENLMLYGQ